MHLLFDFCTDETCIDLMADPILTQSSADLFKPRAGSKDERAE